MTVNLTSLFYTISDELDEEKVMISSPITEEMLKV